MSCERFEALLAEYCAGALSHEDEDRVEQHLQQCAQCNDTVELWNKLGELPASEPSPALRTRFEAMLSTYQELGARGSIPGASRWKLSPLAALFGAGGWGRAAAATAFAAVLLVMGFAAGRYMGGGGRQEEMARMRADMQEMRQLVVLSMLQQQSASKRLEAVAMGSQQAQPDPKILAALLDTLRLDNSVDVRLAALHALSEYSQQPVVRDGLVNALQGSQSPMVQVALIDLLVELRDRRAVSQLQNVQQASDLNPAVRQRAEWALRELQ